jgi:hypothetical protein
MLSVLWARSYRAYPVCCLVGLFSHCSPARAGALGGKGKTLFIYIRLSPPKSTTGVGKFTTGVGKSATGAAESATGVGKFTTTVVKPVVITEKPAKGISQVCFTANRPQFNAKLAMGNKKWIVVSNGRDSRQKPLSDGESTV